MKRRPLATNDSRWPMSVGRADRRNVKPKKKRNSKRIIDGNRARRYIYIYLIYKNRTAKGYQKGLHYRDE